MKRRGFLTLLAGGAGLLVPWEHQRVYSFAAPTIAGLGAAWLEFHDATGRVHRVPWNPNVSLWTNETGAPIMIKSCRVVLPTSGHEIQLPVDNINAGQWVRVSSLTITQEAT